MRGKSMSSPTSVHGGRQTILTHDFESVTLQVFRFRNRRNDQMIRGLAVDGDAPQEATGIVSSSQDDFEEQLGIDMVRAAEGRQRAAGAQQFQRAQMDFLVAAERIGNRGAVAGTIRSRQHGPGARKCH